jgi:hypothetical protein
VSLGRLLLLVPLAALTAGCGGDEPTRDDAGTVKVMLQQTAEVQGAMQPLYFCLPDDLVCYRQAGPEIVSVVDRAQRAAETAVANTDDDCLQEAAGLFRDSLEAYGDAGRAATAGDVPAVDAAIAETTRLEIAYHERISECGFVEGRIAEQSAALREVDVALLRLGEELAACSTEACALDVIARTKAAADDGVAAVDRLRAEMAEDDEVPECVPAVLGKRRGAFIQLKSAWESLEAGDIVAFENKAKLAAELETAVAGEMAACLTSAGV